MGFLLPTCLLISSKLSASSPLSRCCRGKYFLLFVLHVTPPTFPLQREALNTQFPPILFIPVMLFEIPSEVIFSPRLIIYQVSPLHGNHLLSFIILAAPLQTSLILLLGGIRAVHQWWPDSRLLLWQVDIQ